MFLFLFDLLMYLLMIEVMHFIHKRLSLYTTFKTNNYDSVNVFYTNKISFDYFFAEYILSI